MDTRTLSIAIGIVGTALALLMIIFAVYRRQKGITIMAVGVCASVVAFFLFGTQGSLSPWISVLLSNTLVMVYHMSLPWGMRHRLGFRNTWPRRYWVYLPLFALIFTFAGVIYDIYYVRAITVTVFIIALTLEFMVVLAQSKHQFGVVIQRAAWVIVGSFALLHFTRFVLVLVLNETGSLMSNTVASNFLLEFVLFFSVLWVGLILAVDASSLVNELETKNRQLQALASTDELTGVHNRRSLEDTIDAEMVRALRYKTPLTMVMLDLDHFKHINDTWGHDRGDEVLKETVRRIAEIIRVPDNIYRWGGEEFVILAPHTNLDGARVLSEKIRLAISDQPYEVVGSVSASFGVAEWIYEDSREHWFKAMDHALYRAKNKGRNNVQVFGRHENLPIAFVKMDWHVEWESGNAVVDAEHRTLLELSNDLLDLSLSGAAQEQIVGRLLSLLDHVVKHFADEEQVLAELSYPDLVHHAQLHARLVSDAIKLKDEVLISGSDPSIFFNFIVGRVVMGHLLSADVKFFPYTRGLKAG